MSGQFAVVQSILFLVLQNLQDGGFVVGFIMLVKLSCRNILRTEDFLLEIDNINSTQFRFSQNIAADFQFMGMFYGDHISVDFFIIRIAHVKKIIWIWRSAPAAVIFCFLFRYYTSAAIYTKWFSESCILL